MNIGYCNNINKNKDTFYTNGIEYNYNIKVLITNKKIEKLYNDTKDNKNIDWKKPLNEQLYKLFDNN